MKKVLLSSVAALAVFAAAAPAFAEQGKFVETARTEVRDAQGKVTGWNITVSDGKESHTSFSPAYDGGQVVGDTDLHNPKVKDPFKNGPTTVKTEKTNKHVRVTVLDGGGRPVPGATIDFMYKGYSIGSAVTNVGGDAEIEYLFNEGDVVEFRVGKTATDFKELVTATGSVTVTADMYTNGSVTLPYKLDDRAATINTNSKDVKASDNNQNKEEAKSEAQKTEKGAKAAKDGKAASAQAGKALPKTSAAK
ncbi:hypothetical protein LPB220_00210 [Streptococcus sp. LPB0220]|uniref:hypothetical protein n=1 Tax=Streptococcus sp. LPB0220 TaxID=2610896 RepID=UPI001248B95D|nr:hypothetical protein [Streptococcus sp. LPB0220]QEW08769.1 hypothetical protein LPB220_00210 [Streptococcus sp. LPB0220]